jgi:cyanophycinase
MDALIAAAVRATAAVGDVVRIVIVPTAASRQRPEAAVAHGERAFRAAAARAGVVVEVEAALVTDAASAADPAKFGLLEGAHLVHLPGGDPDLIPSVLRGSPAWAAILRAHAAGACIAGASAGAMALGDRLWTPNGAADGLGLVPGIAVLPHFDASRLDAWRRGVDPESRLTWLGLDERTLVIGRPGEPWRVAGAGRARVRAPDGTGTEAGDGGVIGLG